MTHRFFVGDSSDRLGSVELGDKVWLNEPGIVNQITRVLRMRDGEELVLFDGKGLERQYKIIEIEAKAVHLQHVCDHHTKSPDRHVILAWSLLKKDKNDWVLQKCTELGVTHFLPMVTDRTEKTGFLVERAHKIVVEAVEQCGRHDIPVISEPQGVHDVVGEYRQHMPVFYTDMEGPEPDLANVPKVLVLVGPEGGWSEKEREYFAEKGIAKIGLGKFTLRAETACLAAVQKLA